MFCVLKHCLSLKAFVPNFVAFLVLLGIVISCIRMMLFYIGHFGKTGVYTSHCFIIQLPGGGQCPLVRDSEPIRLLEIPMSSSLYMLIQNIRQNINGHFFGMVRKEAVFK